jgi:hypothetical protein
VSRTAASKSMKASNLPLLMYVLTLWRTLSCAAL